jgi:hypothetical protein
MDIRQAILKAADYIEANPSEFDFNAFCIPHPCGSPGCALGWIGYFSGLKPETFGFSRVAHEVMNLGIPGHGEFVFYQRMDAICGGRYRWKQSAELCAHTLRGYADKYHPAPVVTPDWEKLSSPVGVPTRELA